MIWGDEDVKARCPVWVPTLVWVALVTLLVLAAVTPGHFDDPAAAYRLVAYPVLALLLPLGWRLTHDSGAAPPYAAFTLVMLPFLIDTIGNVLGLYAAISWWDDLNHFTNWLLLTTGLGLVLFRSVRPRWAVAVTVTGLGALLAIAWELGEWATYYSGRDDLSRVYADTLGDETLGTLGALVAGLIVALASRPRP